jgi:hypothetical protein
LIVFVPEKKEPFNFNFNQKSKSNPDLKELIKLFKKEFRMTILEETRKNIPTTDGYLDFEKFIDLATKCYASARVTTQRDDFILLILSKLSNKAYEIGIAAQPQTWDGIKEALLKKFRKNSSLTTLHTELANCNQKEGEGVFDFSLRLRKTIKKTKSSLQGIGRN